MYRFACKHDLEGIVAKWARGVYQCEGSDTLTQVKNPEYSDTLYVTELVAPNTVNTMPEKTIDAVADHGVITGDTVTGTAEESQALFDELTAVGIDLPDVFKVLEDEGVEKFEKSWLELIEATQGQLDAAKK